MLRIKQNSAATGNQQHYVPLKQVTIEANIRSFAADVTIKQVFRNDEATSIEAVYCFPIEEQAAIYAFTAQIDDRQIIAQLKEKKQAQQEYNDALQQGHGAYLLEQDEKSQDNFIINVGALPPGKECHIKICYVTELDLVENGTKIRFVVPTTIAPRYNPHQGGVTSPAGTTSTYVQSVPYTVQLHCRIDKVDITRVSSSSHPIQVDFSQQNDVYIIEFAQQNSHLDRDILIDIELAQQRSNTIIAVNHDAIMASFTPNEQDCQRAIDGEETTNEFIFVVDCSGSMSDENKIGFARQAMLLFLKSLPVNCHFNIVRFGSNYEPLFEDITAVYDKQNAQLAEQLTKNMQATLGGTELLLPLRWLEEHPPKQGRARQIFLLTDGEVSNVDEVMDLCRSMAASSRIFSFGLGRSPSRSLVKGLARATNGRFVFIPPEKSVDIYVGEQLQKALQSCITNVEVKWNVGRNVINVPSKTPPVYVNDRLIVYALATDDADGQSPVFDHNSSVELLNGQHRLGEAKVNRIPNISDDGTIARLAAKALILELQHSKLPSSEKTSGSRQSRFTQQVTEARTRSLNDEKEERKKHIIELSLKYKILSPHTSFVGVEKRVNGNNDDMILREVPIQISADDQHLDIFAPTSMAAVSTQNYSNTSTQNCWNMSTYNYSNNNSNTMFDCMDMDMMCCDLSSASALDYEDECWSNAPLPDLDDDDLFQMSTKTANLYDPFVSPIQTNMKTEGKQEMFPSDDESIVRYLISKQEFDGLWDLDSKNIEQLTGKPLSHFQHSSNVQVLISTIVVLVLETRFASLSSMWYGIVQKARKHLLDLFGKDNKKLDVFFEDIRKQL